MQESTQAIEPRPSLDDFAAMLDETLGTNNRLEGSVVRGTVVGIDDDIVIVDVGLKSEGRVPLKEFGAPGQPPEVQVGDTVEVFVERFENRGGEVVLSREKAKREESWNRLERAFNDTDQVSRATSSAGSRAASPSTSAVPWPSCRAARSTSGPCATSAR